MRSIAIAIVDDNETFLRGTAGQVKTCLDALNVRHAVSLFDDPEKFLEASRGKCFDIAFLDVFFSAGIGATAENGSGGNGIDLARELRAANEKCQIVFLSVSGDYALHGYEVKAANYLVKPIRPETLGAALRDCLARLERDEREFVVVKDGPELLLLNAEDIIYIEVKGRYVSVYGEKGPIAVRFGRLPDIVPILPPLFLRIHQAYFVNITRVSSMKNYRMHMDTGVVLPISRPYRASAANAFFDAVRKA